MADLKHAAQWGLAGKFLVVYVSLVALILAFVAVRGYQFRDDQAQRNREFTVFVCESQNQRWEILLTKLKENLMRGTDETNLDYALRRERTLNLVDGIYNVPCATKEQAP